MLWSPTVCFKFPSKHPGLIRVSKSLSIYVSLRCDSIQSDIAQNLSLADMVNTVDRKLK